jgi:hypothetical protein
MIDTKPPDLDHYVPGVAPAELSPWPDNFSLSGHERRGPRRQEGRSGQVASTELQQWEDGGRRRCAAASD